MSHHRQRAVVCLLLASLLCLSACTSGSGASSTGTPQEGGASAAQDPSASSGGSSTPSPGASQTPTVTGTLTQEEQDDPGAPAWGTGGQGQEASADSSLVITDVRVGSHDDEGYDRIVIELAGEGTPGWSPQWTEEAHTLGKGDPVTVGGDYVLVVTGTGVTMPTPEQQDQAYSGNTRFTMDARGITEAYVDLAVEDQFQVVLGTESQSYRIFTLPSPTRLVVDVADDDTGERGDG